MKQIPHYRVKAKRTRDWKPDLTFEKFFGKEFLDGRGWGKFRDEFSWTSRDDLCILRSLRFHSSRREMVRINLRQPTQVEIKKILAHLEESYSAARPREMRVWNEEFFFEALKEVDMNSTPGWPWKESYKTNADFLLNADGTANISNLMLLYEAVEERLLVLERKPEADDINVFVKDELHKITKVQDGAFRLISSVSLTDTMVDRLLFGDFFKNCYTFEGFSQTPNKAGWTPYLGGYKWFARRHRRGPRLFADKSSWDWTMMPWVAFVLMHLMLRFCGFDDVVRRNQIKHRFEALFVNPIFNVGGWLRFRQQLAGLMKSGCLGTIIWNGIAQVALHSLASLRGFGRIEDDPDVIGDDTVQKLMADLESYLIDLNQAGCISRDYHVADLSKGGKIDFAGHEFDQKESIPAYGKKHMGCLYESSEFKKDQLESYMRLYAFDPEVFMRVTAWLRELGGVVYSREYIKDWYNGDLEEKLVYV